MRFGLLDKGMALGKLSNGSATDSKNVAESLAELLGSRVKAFTIAPQVTQYLRPMPISFARFKVTIVNLVFAECPQRNGKDGIAIPQNMMTESRLHDSAVDNLDRILQATP